jgi:hypothetical protein
LETLSRSRPRRLALQSVKVLPLLLLDAERRFFYISTPSRRRPDWQTAEIKAKRVDSILKSQPFMKRPLGDGKLLKITARIRGGGGS